MFVLEYAAIIFHACIHTGGVSCGTIGSKKQKPITHSGRMKHLQSLLSKNITISRQIQAAKSRVCVFEANKSADPHC